MPGLVPYITELNSSMPRGLTRGVELYLKTNIDTWSYRSSCTWIDTGLRNCYEVRHLLPYKVT